VSAVLPAGVDVMVKGRPDAPDRPAFVTLPGARLTVRVRVSNRNRSDGTRWLCDACGRFTLPVCPHAAAVAAFLIGEPR